MKTPAKDVKAHSPAHAIFAMVRKSDGAMLFAVEAIDPEEAQARANSVAHLFGLPPKLALRIRRLKAAPTGVPTFFKGYFEPIGCQSAQARVGPSTRTVQ